MPSLQVAILALTVAREVSRFQVFYDNHIKVIQMSGLILAKKNQAFGWHGAFVLFHFVCSGSIIWTTMTTKYEETYVTFNPEHCIS